MNGRLGKETVPKHDSAGIVYVPEAAQRAVLEKPRRLHDDLIFRSKRGKQIRQESWHRTWDQVRNAFVSNLPETHHLRQRLRADPDDRFDFYELRHFGASYMLNVLGLEPWVIAEQLRHHRRRRTRRRALRPSRTCRGDQANQARIRGHRPPDQGGVREPSGEAR
jgi:integrase